MDLKHELGIYTSDINFIQRQLHSDTDSKFIQIFNNMINYYEQIQSINSPNSVLFNVRPTRDQLKETTNLSKVDRSELKSKLFLKLNTYVNEQIDLAQAIM